MGEVTEFIRALFEPGDVIDLRAIHKDQAWVKDDSPRGGHWEPTPKIFHFHANRIDTALEMLTTLNAEGRAIYFGVNPRRGKSMTDVAAFRAICVDLDGPTIDGVKRPLAEATILQYLMDRCGEIEVPFPTIVIHSGNGGWAFWRVAGIEDAGVWTNTQKRLALAFEKYADPAIHDAPRVARLPGFTNWRGGYAAKIIFVERHDPYGPECFANLPPLPSPVAPTSTGTSGNPADQSSLDRAMYYFAQRPGATEGQRNNEAYKIAAACLRDFSLSDADTAQVVLAWNARNTPPLDGPEILRVIRRASAGARGPEGAKNRDKPADPPRRSAQPSSDPFSEAAPPPDSRIPGSGKMDLELLGDLLRDVHLVTGTTQVWHSSLGMRMPLEALSALHPEETKAWKLDRGKRLVRDEDLVFAPGGVVTEGQVNTFRGFRTRPDERDCPMLRDHLRYLCDGDPTMLDWVTCWLAHQVKFPGVKLASALVIHGGQGTGKSMYFECFGEIFAPYSTRINQTVMESDYTGWSENRCFVLAEEVLAVKQRSRLKNLIKQLVTGGRIVLNRKYGGVSYDVPCGMNLVFLSNELMPMLVESDDRRYCVIRRDGPKDEDYYVMLAQEIADNGPGRLLNYLLAYDLGEWHPHKAVPHSQARQELIAVSAPSYEEFLDAWTADEIEELPFLAAAGQDLYYAYSAWCRATGSHRYDSGFALAHAKKHPKIDYRKSMR
ncbi:MAG: DUF5906 domain-containing protein, partial [Candidatus Omnitrophota bacterium]|nr:DUF5906 domain-containing protein [Candidatus Omnitrophota bacterium]